MVQSRILEQERERTIISFRSNKTVSIETTAAPAIQKRSIVSRIIPNICSGGLVVVITRSVVNPKKRRDRLQAIIDTWGRDLLSRGVRLIILASELSECPSPINLGSKAQLYLTCVKPPDPLDLATDKAKVFEWLALDLVSSESQLLSSADYSARAPIIVFLFWCNDHSYILPQNFVAYVSGLVTSAMYPIYAGKELQSGGRRFNSGAAGILLNKRSLQILRAHWNDPENYPECFPPSLQSKTSRPVRRIPENHSFGKVKEPGLLLADCLYLRGVLPNRTRDDGTSFMQDSTEDRFHAFGPQRLVAGTVDEWYKNYHKSTIQGEKLSPGLACCSASTTTFHYVETAEARAIYAVLADPSKFKQMKDTERRAFWPKPSELSYSSPPGPNDLMWEFLTSKIKSSPWHCPLI